MREDIEKEVERILPLVPTHPPEGHLETLKKRGFLGDERLLYGIEYGHGEKKVKVQCTHCKGEMLLDYAGNECCRYGATYGFINPVNDKATGNGDNCICPMCGEGVRAIHKGGIRSCTEIDSRVFMTVHNVSSYLAMLSWVTKKMLHHDGRVSYWTCGYEGVLIVCGTLVRIKMYTKFMSQYSWGSKWAYTKRFTENFGAYDRREVIDADPLVVERTESRHSALAEYLKGAGELHPAEYMKLWLKHPNVENLTRQGLTRYVSDVISNSHSYSSYYRSSFNVKQTNAYINWAEVKPSLMLGVEKDELKTIRQVSLEGVSFYKEIKERKGIRLDAETLAVISRYGYGNVRGMIFSPMYVASVPLIRLINYLEKQMKVAGARKALITTGHLNDYWRACYKVYGRIPDEIAYPKDLIEAHDDMIARVEEKENAELQAKISKRLEELTALEYRNEELGLLIRPAASQLELIAEGKALHHCVGGYANSYAAGSTSIFFIRKISEPDVPFFTLEYKGNKVNQNRGDRNCERTPEVKQFEAAWLEHIKTITKETNKNGKRREEGIRAGA